MRGLAYRRDIRDRKIRRKRAISKNYWHVDHLGMLDKGKIHCSCWMCATKSKTLGRPHSELKRAPRIEDYE